MSFASSNFFKWAFGALPPVRAWSSLCQVFSSWKALATTNLLGSSWSLGTLVCPAMTFSGYLWKKKPSKLRSPYLFSSPVQKVALSMAIWSITAQSIFHCWGLAIWQLRYLAAFWLAGDAEAFFKLWVSIFLSTVAISTGLFLRNHVAIIDFEDLNDDIGASATCPSKHQPYGQAINAGKAPWPSAGPLPPPPGLCFPEQYFQLIPVGAHRAQPYATEWFFPGLPGFSWSNGVDGYHPTSWPVAKIIQLFRFQPQSSRAARAGNVGEG